MVYHQFNNHHIDKKKTNTHITLKQTNKQNTNFNRSLKAVSLYKRDSSAEFYYKIKSDAPNEINNEC